MSDQSIVIPAQEQIEVFVNDGGTVSIVQRSSLGRDEDSIIAIHPNHVGAVAAALRRAAKEARSLPEDGDA